MFGTDQYRHISIETSNDPRMGKGSISISQTMHQGYRYQSVLCVQMVMLVVSGTCVLLEISNSVCTKYNEPTLLHATIYICQQDKYKVDVCMQRSAIGLSKENLYALP